MNENELIHVAMQIILHAGDARLKIEEALKEAKSFDFLKAREWLKEAEECIRLAHMSQTQVIQNEAGGKAYQPSLLFSHAQDTLMTIMSELMLASEMIDFYEIINQKIESLSRNDV